MIENTRKPAFSGNNTPAVSLTTEAVVRHMKDLLILRVSEALPEDIENTHKVSVGWPLLSWQYCM